MSIIIMKTIYYMVGKKHSFKILMNVSAFTDFFRNNKVLNTKLDYRPPKSLNRANTVGWVKHRLKKNKLSFPILTLRKNFSQNDIVQVFGNFFQSSRCFFTQIMRSDLLAGCRARNPKLFRTFWMVELDILFTVVS